MLNKVEPPFLHLTALGYLCPSVLIPEKIHVQKIADFVSNFGLTGITSIACGACVWEFFLSEFYDNIMGIDIADTRIPQSQNRISFTLVLPDLQPEQLPKIPQDHALLSIFPIPKVPLEDYIRQYTGKCFILLADHAYSRLDQLKEVLIQTGFVQCFDSVSILPWGKAFMVWERNERSVHL